MLTGLICVRRRTKGVCCEHGYDCTGCIKFGEFLDYPNVLVYKECLLYIELVVCSVGLVS